MPFRRWHLELDAHMTLEVEPAASSHFSERCMWRVCCDGRGCRCASVYSVNYICKNKKSTARAGAALTRPRLAAGPPPAAARARAAPPTHLFVCAQAKCTHRFVCKLQIERQRLSSQRTKWEGEKL